MKLQYQHKHNSFSCTL